MKRNSPSQPIADKQKKQTLRSIFVEAFQLLALFFVPQRNRASAVYELLGAHNNLAEESLFLNLGYWKEASTYDDACTALAHEVAEAACFEAGDTVLDCGFGFGDQDAYWIENFPIASINAINVSTQQVQIAKARFRDERIRFQEGSATRIPFPDSTFHKVVALESAFHFDTREAFFREAHRVLKQNGTLTAADVIAGPNTRGLRGFIMEYLGRAFWQIPKCNMIHAEDYKTQLEAAGFVDVVIRNISNDVFIPFKEFARARTDAPEVKRRLHPWLRAMWRAPHRGLHVFEYVIVSATKSDGQPAPSEAAAED